MLLSDKSIEFIRPGKHKKSQCVDSQRIAISSIFGVFSTKRAVGGKIGQNEARLFCFRGGYGL
jgi:hypothetical protein